jgi:hypothetical protein
MLSQIREPVTIFIASSPCIHDSRFAILTKVGQIRFLGKLDLSYQGMFGLQVTALSNAESKKKFEFLEAVSGTMDAHLRYFKQVRTALVHNNNSTCWRHGWIQQTCSCHFFLVSSPSIIRLGHFKRELDHPYSFKGSEHEGAA